MRVFSYQLYSLRVNRALKKCLNAFLPNWTKKFKAIKILANAIFNFYYAFSCCMQIVTYKVDGLN